MRAVNLLPDDYRRSRGPRASGMLGPAYLIVGLLGLGVALVTLFVITSNSVADQKSKLASVERALPAVEAQAAQLAPYTQFVNLARQRAQTVSQIAAGRFDWAASMADLARVVPANTSLQSLVATAGTGSSATTGTAATVSAGNGIRGALPNPAFQLRGCTASQDDVARLMSRLRVMSGVIRVALSSTAKQGSGAASAAPGNSGASAGAAGSNCPGNAASFDLVVFFAGPVGASPGSHP